MKQRHKMTRPLSLTQHFDAPDEHIGIFGWVCGYSADAAFLNDAVERFTRCTAVQRAYQGRIALGLLLDPGNPQISLRDVPGVAHLPMKSVSPREFKLLHAKVALLGYRSLQESDHWVLRLIVSTGNWTRQTLEESLDLVWRVDVSSRDLQQPQPPDCLQRCADIKAAWQFMSWLQERFDRRLLERRDGDHPCLDAMAVEQLQQWVQRCSRVARGASHFFDNRRESLLAQLVDKVKERADTRRNYLVMGSGFYESSHETSQVSVPQQITDSLRVAGLLSQNSVTQVYVNPAARQGIATLKDAQFALRKPKSPADVFGPDRDRFLHAKFILSANLPRSNAEKLTQPWIYLDSGNLTNPGFARRMSANAGNLEAGVLLHHESLALADLPRLLPIHEPGDDDDDQSPENLAPGEGMPDRDDVFVAPPVPWLCWQSDGAAGKLSLPPGSADYHERIEILDSVGEPCERTTSGYRWSELDQPREVRVRWGAGARFHEALIPVVDAHGRVAGGALPRIEVEEAWWQLADFPLPPDANDEEEERGEEGVLSRQPMEPKRSALAPGSYPIRQMMELVEQIAAKQTQVTEADWALWCARLEQTLAQASNSAVVTYFRDELKINPLSPLLHSPFRPVFAEDGASAEGRLYEAAIRRVFQCWAVDQLEDRLGDLK